MHPSHPGTRRGRGRLRWHSRLSRHRRHGRAPRHREDVGVLKQRWLELETGPVAREVQHGIKAVFDPLNILNPGKAI